MVDDLAGLGDAADGLVLGQAVPGVEGEVVPVLLLPACGRVLLMQSQPRHLHGRALALFPAHGGPVQRHAVRVRPELEQQVEGGRAGGQAVAQVPAQEGGVFVRRRCQGIPVRAAGRDELVLHVPVRPEGVRQHTPVRGRERALDGLAHVRQDLPGEGVLLLVRRLVQLELAHVPGRVDEEDVVVLEYEILCVGPGVVRKQFRPRHAEQLDAPPDRPAQIRPVRLGVAGDAHPGGQAALFRRGLEETDAELGRQIGGDRQHAAGRPVELDEDRAQEGILPLGDAVPHPLAHELGHDPGDRLVDAVARGWLRGAVGHLGALRHGSAPACRRPAEADRVLTLLAGTSLPHKTSDMG